MSDYERARKDRWKALTRYDPEISPLAEVLSGFGQKWIDEFESAFFALNEDRSYLGPISERLITEAEAERAQIAREREAENRNAWMARIKKTNDGEITTDLSLKIIDAALLEGFEIKLAENHTIEITKSGMPTYFLYSNADIADFARLKGIQVKTS